MTDEETLIHLFFRAVDQRDWEAVGHAMSKQVAVDYTSLFGGEAETVTGDELLQRWQGMLPGFDATQHFVGPLVSTSPGVMEGNVRGFHALDGEVWMVAGWYTLNLQSTGGGIRIAGITLTTSYETGDRGLVDRAQQRAQQRTLS